MQKKKKMMQRGRELKERNNASTHANHSVIVGPSSVLSVLEDAHGKKE